MSTPGFSRAELEQVELALSSTPRTVRFQDVDAAGTVYYARVFEYFGDAYVALLERGGVDLRDMIAAGEVLAPLVHAEADYLSPLRFGDAITVEVAMTRVGGSSITVGYRILSGSRLCAIGHTVHVFVDAKTFGKREVPAAIRSAMNRLG